MDSLAKCDVLHLQFLPRCLGAEGCGRNSQAEFVRFLIIALGSASELEYQILLSGDLGFIDTNKSKELKSDVTEIKRMLSSLLKKVQAES